MKSRYFDYLYIAASIGFTVYGQLILKWRIRSFGALPADPLNKLKFFAALLSDPAILSGFVAAFLAALAWMAAMTKFELSYAYPFMSLNFMMVLILSGFLLREPLTPPKIIGIVLIILGTVVASRG